MIKITLAPNDKMYTRRVTARLFETIEQYDRWTVTGIPKGAIQIVTGGVPVSVNRDTTYGKAYAVDYILNHPSIPNYVYAVKLYDTVQYRNIIPYMAWTVNMRDWKVVP